jgi:hypothetical protein
MRLSLSSETARGATPRELIAACARRGLVGLELHLPDLLLEGGAAALADAAALGRTAANAGVAVCGIYRPRLPASEIVATAIAAAAFDAPAVVPVAGFDRALLTDAAAAFALRGARLLLAHDTDPRVADAIRWLMDAVPHREALGLAWEVRPGVDDPARVPDVLDATGAGLAYVRLHGGGPEAQAQGGMGIGALMARLTLTRYQGPIVLTPSDPRYHVAWNAWLGRGGGWGCGSRQSEPDAVHLEVPLRRTLEVR